MNDQRLYELMELLPEELLDEDLLFHMQRAAESGKTRRSSRIAAFFRRDMDQDLPQCGNDLPLFFLIETIHGDRKYLFPVIEDDDFAVFHGHQQGRFCVVWSEIAHYTNFSFFDAGVIAGHSAEGISKFLIYSHVFAIATVKRVFHWISVTLNRTCG